MLRLINTYLKMKKIVLLAIAMSTLVFTNCKSDKKENTDMETNTVMETETPATNDKMISMRLEPKSDSQGSGKVSFTQKGDIVMFEAFVEGLSPGMHAIHIHESSDCSSADGKSAGGHWNPTFQDHGKWGSPSGYHKGDIGNFKVDEDGTGSISMQTDQWCIGCDDDTKNIIGKSIIVHQGVDDFTSQPSGDAGARIQCGGIIQ